MNLPTAAWTQRYVQNGCGGECGSDNLGAPTQSTGRLALRRLVASAPA